MSRSHCNHVEYEVIGNWTQLTKRVMLRFKYVDCHFTIYVYIYNNKLKRQLLFIYFFSKTGRDVPSPKGIWCPSKCNSKPMLKDHVHRRSTMFPSQQWMMMLGSTGEQLLCVPPKLLNQISALGHAVTSNHCQVVNICILKMLKNQSRHTLGNLRQVLPFFLFFSFRTYCCYFFELVWGP